MFRLPFKEGFTISDKSKIEKYDLNLDWMITQEEIEIVHGNGTHVAILGAGATLATTDRNPEKNDKQLPLMNNIVEVVGLEDIVDKLPDDIQKHTNEFEKLYSKRYDLNDQDAERKK